MRFAVLGPLSVQDDEGRPVTVPEAKVRLLLGCLLAREGRPVATDLLVDALWGDDPPGRAANALQVKVSVLRRALGRDRVVHRAPGYLIRLADAELDAARFRALTARARETADARERAALLGEALGLWRGTDAYADVADHALVREESRRLAEERLLAVEERAEARLEWADRPGLAALAAELAPLVAAHPLRERLRAARLRALYGAGRQGEALASYEDLRERLAEELGVDPGPELAGLHTAILRQELPVPAGRRPTPLTALVGREDEVRGAAELLRTARLVTITGPGGVGKTRLAQEVALREPADGWFVELAGVAGAEADARNRTEAEAGDRAQAASRAEAVAEAVAGALGLRDDSAASLPRFGGPDGTAQHPDGTAQRLAAVLRDRPAPLLVLDNCEHVVDAVAALAEELLRSAPGLRILATGREPLGIPGEEVRPLEPLPPADAVRLFAERARAASPSFALTEDNHADVSEICARLDGIPLALELAATRVRGLGTKELAARLGDRFRVLTTGRRGAPPRQQTLRAMIDWSWELLSAPERIVLRRLAVHRDGCTLDAAEAVCGSEGHGGAVPGDASPARSAAHRLDVADLLGRLVDRSLVVRDGERYRMLESIAAYATERLYEWDDAGPVRARHRAYYLALAERAAPQLRGAGQREWLRRLDAESANLAAAACHGGGNGGAGGDSNDGEPERFSVAPAWYWLLSGRLREGRRRLAEAAGAEARVLEAAFALLCGERTDTSALPYASIADPAARARAQWLVAYGHFHTGDLAESERIVAGVGDADPWARAAVHTLRATHAMLRGDLAAQRRHGREGRALFRELGDRWGELQSVPPLASLAEIDGEYGEAARLHEDGLRLAEELGLAAERSARLAGLGRLALLTGDGERAAELHERARRGAAEQGYKFGEIYAELGLALGARRAGRLDEAERLLLKIRDWYREISSEEGNHLVLVELGFVAELRGDAAAARAHHLRALTLARATRDPRARALALEGLAGAEALAGRAPRAGWLLAAAAALRAGAGAPLPPAERGDVSRITAAVGEAAGQLR